MEGCGQGWEVQRARVPDVSMELMWQSGGGSHGSREDRIYAPGGSVSREVFEFTREEGRSI